MAGPQRAVIPPDDPVAKWNAELAFRSVVEATADKAGLDFLRHLVKNLAQSLGVAYAFVAEFADAADRVKTIAFWSGDDWARERRVPPLGHALRARRGGPALPLQGRRPAPVPGGLRPRHPRRAQLSRRAAARRAAARPSATSRRSTPSRCSTTRAASRSSRCSPTARASRWSGCTPRRCCTARCSDARGAPREHAAAIWRSRSQSLDLAYGELQALLEINQSSTRHLRRTDLFARARALREAAAALRALRHRGADGPRDAARARARARPALARADDRGVPLRRHRLPLGAGEPPALRRRLARGAARALPDDPRRDGARGHGVALRAAAAARGEELRRALLHVDRSATPTARSRSR